MGAGQDKTPEHLARQRPEQPLVERPSYASVAAHASNTLPRISTPNAQSRKWTVFRKPPKRLAKVTPVPIKKHPVLGNEDLLWLILSYLEPEPGTLSKVLRVVHFFREIGMKFLWREANISNLLCVTDDKRRQEYASKISTVLFIDEQPMWPASGVSCPELNKVRSLELCATSWSANEPHDLVRFINKALKELFILRSCLKNSVAMQTAGVPRDDVWISHIISTCDDLTTLEFETPLDLSPCKLITLFRAVSHLRTLHLGRELNAALENDTIMTILKLPALNDLSLDRPLDSSFVAEMLAARNEILPQATKLRIGFATSEDPATGDLLSRLTKLQKLSVVFESGIPNQVVVPHAAFLEVISGLSEPHCIKLVLNRRRKDRVLDRLKSGSVIRPDAGSDRSHTSEFES